MVGKNLTEAKELLEGMGLRVEVEQVDSTEPYDEVLEQNPPNGAGVEANTVIKLKTSNNPTGTPMGALGVGAENPAGTTIAGKPVNAAKMPFRSGWNISPIGTTKRF